MPETEADQSIFFEEIDKILTMAKEEGATMRLLGATAIRSRSPSARKMAGQRPLTDLDFVAYKKDRSRIEKLLKGLNYEPSVMFNMAHGNERLLFFGHEGKLKIDVWLEVFRMAHTFSFKERLELDYPTLPLSDLLMTKLQIVELNEKDARDVVCLLIDHELSKDDVDREKINLSRLVNECSGNWGVYKTFTMNLLKIKDLASTYVNDPKAAQSAVKKIDEISNSIEAAPKTLAWKLRARVGEKKPWYESPDSR
jgi:hypothetical protein